MRLFSNLNEACKDLRDKGKPESEELVNILYAHLPFYVLIDDYLEWYHKYLSTNPNAPITSIRLFQPAYAKDSGQDINSLFILYKEILRKGEKSDGLTLNGQRLINQFPIGMTAGKPFELQFKRSNARLRLMHYWYQSGHVYLFDEIKGPGSIKHNMRYDYGIHTHSIIRINGAILSRQLFFSFTKFLIMLIYH